MLLLVSRRHTLRFYQLDRNIDSIDGFFSILDFFCENF